MRVTWEPGKRPKELREPDDWDSANLEILRKDHEAADHGVHAVEAMVYCYEARIHPPQWLVDWLGDHLASWLDSESGTIDKALNISSPGRGRQHPLNRLRLHRERSDQAHEIFVLNDIFQISVDKAAEMVQRRWEAENRETPGAEFLADSYRKTWRKTLTADAKSTIRDVFRDEDSRRKYLARYPV